MILAIAFVAMSVVVVVLMLFAFVKQSSMNLHSFEKFDVLELVDVPPPNMRTRGCEQDKHVCANDVHTCI